MAELPIRTAAAGTRLQFAEEVIAVSATDRVAVVTIDQQRAAYPIDADRVRLVTGDDSDSVETVS